MDTLAFGYILPTTGRIRDFNPLETCAARRTQQKKDRVAKFLCILCLSLFSIIVLMLLFFTGAFFFIQNEPNLEEALFTLALGAFCLGLALFQYGIPLLLLGVSLPQLLLRRNRPQNVVKKVCCILLLILSILWLFCSRHLLQIF